MRNAFIETLCGLAREDERIWLVCGDLGYSVLEGFMREFPRRYLNAGVAEQDMTGIAAGLAMTGKVVFTYSIANFPVMRCMEQIRNDVCYHRLNVKIVAVGGGYAYGGQGYTHHGVEDLGMLRLLPHMTVLAPGDPAETRWAAAAVAAHDGPCYLRLGRGGEKPVHAPGTTFTLGKATLVRGGNDAAIISCGAMLPVAVEAAGLLAKQGVNARVLSMHTFWPVDRDAILAAAGECRGIVTVEEHALGGLATIVAEVLAETGTPARFRPLRLGREPLQIAGSQAYLRSLQGLSTDDVVRAVTQMM